MKSQNTNTKFVTTYNGEKALREDCKYIKGNYFIKHKQCFFINNNWYRITSDKIVFDYELNTWVIKSNNNLVYGIIGLSDIYSVPHFGYFSPNESANIYLYYQNSTHRVIRESILKGNSLIAEGVNGIYYFTNELVPNFFTQKVKPRKEDFYSFPFNYGSDPLIPEFSKRFISDFQGVPLKSTAYRFLDPYTFGIEFETEKGAIPERHIINSGLIPCRDGSIAGFEYTTIPLQGITGIQCIKNSCTLLQKYCSCSANESLHIHIGGYNRRIKDIAALYKLGILIEEEIYSIFPYYYVNTGNFKRKGYCNPLYKVNIDTNSPRDIFLGIYNYLSGGESRFTKFPTGTHPLDRSGQHKWDISPRYHWLNLIPLIWGNRGTVEFRCHTPTLNAQKVINWLFIVVAILKYAKKYTNRLVGSNQIINPVITISDILIEIYPKEIYTILISYINDRKKHYNKKNDLTGELEVLGESIHKEIFNLIEFV